MGWVGRGSRLCFPLFLLREVGRFFSIFFLLPRRTRPERSLCRMRQ